MSYRYHKSFRKDSSSGKRDKKNATGRSRILGGGYRYHAHLNDPLDLVSSAEPASVASELQVAKEKAQAIIDAAHETIDSRINFDTIVKY